VTMLGGAQRFSYSVYPSWFGGDLEATIAVGELAWHTAENLDMEVGEIAIDDSNVPWIASIEFLPKA